MPTPSIGSFACFKIDGKLPSGGLKGRSFVHRGVAGTGTHIESWRGNTATITGRQVYENEAARVAAANTLERSENTIVTVVDNAGTSWNLMRVDRVTFEYPDPYIYAIGPVGVAGNTFELIAHVELTYMGTA